MKHKLCKMNKNNIIVVVLVVLLIASIGGGWFLWQGKAKLQGEVETLEGERIALQSKIEKGLAYAKSLDILLEPARKQAGLPVKRDLSEEELLLELTDAIEATADSQLQDNLDDMKKGGNAASEATILFMEHTASAIVDTLE